MPMDPYQAARDRVIPQIQGRNRSLVLDRALLWAAVKAAGGSVTVHPSDLAEYRDGASSLTATTDASGAMTLTAA